MRLNDEQYGTARLSLQAKTGEKGWTGSRWTSNAQQRSQGIVRRSQGHIFEQITYITYITGVTYLF